MLPKLVWTNHAKERLQERLGGGFQIPAAVLEQAMRAEQNERGQVEIGLNGVVIVCAPMQEENKLRIITIYGKRSKPNRNKYLADGRSGKRNRRLRKD